MKKIFFLIITLISIRNIQAQTIFITHGKIEFEKRLNIHKMLDALVGDDADQKVWFENLKKTFPSNKDLYFNLYFDDNKTLYKPGRESDIMQSVPDWLLPPANDNVVYTDLAKKESISQKKIFENTYLVQDSTRKIKWRITSDTRTIAGFECRKAVGIIMDSVYVIAFYSDEIIPGGGPESFSGLPGMILGIAIPRINTTWFATKLELVEVKPEQLAAPQKGKKTDANTLMNALKDRMKENPKYAGFLVWNSML